MKVVGAILKKAREEKGIALGEVALATKINTRILKAIEEGDEKNLPPKTFLRGFVQTYATLLELDVHDVLEKFQEKMGTTKPQPIIEPPEGEEESTIDEGSSIDLEKNSAIIRMVIIGSIVLILFVSIVMLKKKMESYEAEQVVDEIPNVKAIDGENEGDNPDNKDVGTKPDASPTPTPKPTATPTPTPKPTATPTPTPKPTATPTPTPKPTATPTPTPKPTATPTPTPKPTATPTPTPKPVSTAGSREILIEALGPVTITLTVDGKESKFNMAPDEIRTIRAQSNIKLKVSNGGAVNITKNGRDLGIPGNLNESIDLEY